MVPDVMGSILHREIKRLHARLEDMEERIDSLRGIQYGGMVKVQTRVDKLERDSKDLQEALRRSLADGNPNSQAPMSMGTPGTRPSNSSEAPKAKQEKGSEAKEEKVEDLERESQNTGLLQALERICGQVETLEKRVIWLWNHHRNLQQDIDRLRSESTRHDKELQLLVKSPQGSLETSKVLHGGYGSSSRTIYHDEGLNVLGGISVFDHFGQMGISHPNVEATDKSQMEGPGPSTLPAKLSHTFPVDLEFRTKFKWDTAENISAERKTNIHIKTQAEDQLPDISGSTRINFKDAVTFRRRHEVPHTRKLFPLPHPPAANLGQESLKEELKFDPPGGLSGVPQLHLKPQHQAAEASMDQLKSVASNIVGESITDIPNIVSKSDPENVSTRCVEEEDAGKTNKVLEAYEI